MTADEHLNPQQFYHGTNKELNVGDVVVPSGDSGYKRWAYATLKPQHAKTFGSNVYTVKPVDDVSPPRWMERYDNEPRMQEVTSRAGFQVVSKLKDHK